MYTAFATIYFAQHNVKRETERERRRGRHRKGRGRGKWMHNAIIDAAEMEMRETEVGEECEQSRTLKSKTLFTQD